MTTPHRAHHSKLEHAFVAVLSLLVACGGTSLPRPGRTQVRAEDYVAVPFPPRPPPVEIVPAPPRRDAVWVDGTWTWEGDRYTWQPGGWVLPPAGASHARWVIVRRAEDGQLFFAPSSWRGADGEPIAEPEALVRARSRATDVD